MSRRGCRIGRSRHPSERRRRPPARREAHLVTAYLAERFPQRFTSSTGASDNTTLRLADSVNVFDTGALRSQRHRQQRGLSDPLVRRGHDIPGHLPADGAVHAVARRFRCLMRRCPFRRESTTAFTCKGDFARSQKGSSCTRRQPSAREIERYFLAAEHRPSIFFTADTRIRWVRSPAAGCPGRLSPSGGTTVPLTSTRCPSSLANSASCPESE